MALRVELLVPPKMSVTATGFVQALAGAIPEYGDQLYISPAYRGLGDWLVLYGVGAPDRVIARANHVGQGKRAILWDLGYFGREKITGHLRCSVDHEHPQTWLDITPNDDQRFKKLGIRLREDYNPNGHIILVGLGPKSRSYLGNVQWETSKLKELQTRFPNRRIIYRPKPNNPALDLGIPMYSMGSVYDILRGAALVVCRHSNVAVDAVVAGVPFEAEDGAAMWLADKPYTVQNRLDFLYRLAYWQWRKSEVREAWRFLRNTVKG